MKRSVGKKGGRLLQVLFVLLLLSAMPTMSWATVEQDLKSGLPIAQVLANALKAGMTLEEAVAEITRFYNANQALSDAEKANELARLQAAVREATTVSSAQPRSAIMAPASDGARFPPGRAVASPTK